MLVILCLFLEAGGTTFEPLRGRLSLLVSGGELMTLQFDHTWLEGCSKFGFGVSSLLQLYEVSVFEYQIVPSDK